MKVVQTNMKKSACVGEVWLCLIS